MLHRRAEIEKQEEVIFGKRYEDNTYKSWSGTILGINDYGGNHKLQLKSRIPMVGL
jgi:hypothetical protein